MASDWERTKEQEMARKKRVKETIKQHTKDNEIESCLKCPFTIDECIRLSWCCGGYCCLGLLISGILILISYASTGEWVSPSKQCNREFVVAPWYIQLPSIMITALLTWVISNVRRDKKEEETGAYDIELQIQNNQEMSPPNTPSTSPRSPSSPSSPHSIQSTSTGIFNNEENALETDKIPGSEYENKRSKYKKKAVKCCKNYVLILTVYKIIVFVSNVVVDIIFMVNHPTYFCYSMIVAVSGNYRQYLGVLLITLYKIQLYNRGEFKLEYMGWRTRIWYGIVHILGIIYVPALIVNGGLGVAIWIPCNCCCAICCNVCFRKASAKWKYWSFIRFMILFTFGTYLLMYFTENIPIAFIDPLAVWNGETVVNRNFKDWWNVEDVTDSWEMALIWMFAQLT